MRFNGFNVRPLSLVACFVFLSAIWHSVLLLLATNSSEPTLSTRPLGGGHAGSRHSTTPLALPSLCPFASYTRFANVTALALSVSPYGYSSRSYWRAHRALDDSLDGSAPLGTAVVRALEASRTPSHAGADVASLPALNAATLTLELQRVLWDHYGAPNAQSNGGSDAPAPPSALLVDMNSVLCCGDVIGCTSDERAANATAGDGAACGDAAVVDRCVSAAHDVVASLARVATACGWRALVVGVYPDSPLRTITRSPRVIATTATAMAASTMARAQRQWCAMRALSALLANVSAAAVVSPRVQVVRIVAGRALSAQPSADDVRALCATLHGLVGCAPRGGDTAAVRGVVTAKRALSLHYDAYVAASLGAAELQTWLLETYKGDEFAWKVYGAEMRAEFERLRVANEMCAIELPRMRLCDGVHDDWVQRNVTGTAYSTTPSGLLIRTPVSYVFTVFEVELAREHRDAHWQYMLRVLFTMAPTWNDNTTAASNEQPAGFPRTGYPPHFPTLGERMFWQWSGSLRVDDIDLFHNTTLELQKNDFFLATVFIPLPVQVIGALLRIACSSGAGGSGASGGTAAAADGDNNEYDDDESTTQSCGVFSDDDLTCSNPGVLTLRNVHNETLVVPVAFLPPLRRECRRKVTLARRAFFADFDFTERLLFQSFEWERRAGVQHFNVPYWDSCENHIFCNGSGARRRAQLLAAAAAANVSSLLTSKAVRLWEPDLRERYIEEYYSQKLLQTKHLMRYKQETEWITFRDAGEFITQSPPPAQRWLHDVLDNTSPLVGLILMNMWECVHGDAFKYFVRPEAASESDHHNANLLRPYRKLLWRIPTPIGEIPVTWRSDAFDRQSCARAFGLNASGDADGWGVHGVGNASVVVCSHTLGYVLHLEPKAIATTHELVTLERFMYYNPPLFQCDAVGHNASVWLNQTISIPWGYRHSYFNTQRLHTAAQQQAVDGNASVARSLKQS